MTAPPQIPHGEAVRHSVRVEWMRLETAADVDHAFAWLAAHGVLTDRIGAGLVAYGAGDDCAHLYARIGDRLTYDPDSGEFSVWPEDRYQKAHQEVGA